MNHPIIANNNGQARYNEMLQEAAQYRLQTNVAKPRRFGKLINTLMSLFV